MENLPAKTQDYLKVTWDSHERTGEKVALDDVAGRMDEKKPTVSEAVKKLAVRGLVNHESYRGISLSDRGRDIALTMVRRHRLIESLLVSTFGYAWGKAHEEVKKLEHAISEEFVNRIDAMLGFPECDPHGDSVPSTSGTIVSAVRIGLTDIETGTMMIADRIDGSSPELLCYLTTSGVSPGTVSRAEATPYTDMHVFAILDKAGDTEPRRIHVADPVLQAIKATPTTS